MHLFTSLLALTTLLALSSAFPTTGTSTAQNLPRACGTKLFPTLYTLRESLPFNTSVPSPPFITSQDISFTGTKSNRIYTLAHFSGSFAGSYGCTLHLAIPSGTVLTTHGSAALDIKIIAWPAGAFTPIWANIQPFLGPSGTFGTVTATPGEDSYINSGVCPVSGSTTGLAYVFETSSYVATNAGVSFPEGSGVGPYLTFGC